MNYIENYAKENNFDTIRLTVHKDNIYAIKLYEKFAFKKIENTNWILDNEVFYGFEKEICL